jgi:hypothetical protein
MGGRERPREAARVKSRPGVAAFDPSEYLDNHVTKSEFVANEAINRDTSAAVEQD